MSKVEDLRKEIDKYNKKCSLLGIQPLNLLVYGDKIVVAYMGAMSVFGDDRKDNKVEILSDNLIIPKFVSGIRDDALCFRRDLKSVKLPESLKEIGERAFRHSSIEKIEMKGVESIGEYAFESCMELSSVDISYKKVDIGIWAFYECTGLKDVRLSKHTDTIKECAFRRCVRLRSINTEYIRAIERGAFMMCDGLEKLDLSSIEKIEMNAFRSCTKLKGIELGDKLRYIGVDAFTGCTKLEKVVIRSRDVNIKYGAFCETDNLKEIWIPKNSNISKESLNIYGNIEIIEY